MLLHIRLERLLSVRELAYTLHFGVGYFISAWDAWRVNASIGTELCKTY